MLSETMHLLQAQPGRRGRREAFKITSWAHLHLGDNRLHDGAKRQQAINELFLGRE